LKPAFNPEAGRDKTWWRNRRASAHRRKASTKLTLQSEAEKKGAITHGLGRNYWKIN
jgi:hypothetical protein